MLKGGNSERTNQEAMKRVLKEKIVPFFARLPASKDKKLNKYLAEIDMTRQAWLEKVVDDIKL